VSHALIVLPRTRSRLTDPAFLLDSDDEEALSSSLVVQAGPGATCPMLDSGA